MEGFQSAVPPTFHYQFASELNSAPFLPVCQWMRRETRCVSVLFSDAAVFCGELRDEVSI